MPLLIHLSLLVAEAVLAAFLPTEKPLPGQNTSPYIIYGINDFVNHRPIFHKQQKYTITMRKNADKYAKKQAEPTGSACTVFLYYAPKK